MLILDSVTSTPQWIRQPQPRDVVHDVCESVLFIGTQFSNLYTAVDTPAKGRVDDDVQSAYLELLEEAVVEMMLKKGLFGPTADQGLMPWAKLH